MSGLFVRAASREDIDAFSDMASKPTVRAIVGEIDGRIVALGGIALSKGRWFAFVDLLAEARPYKMTIMRAARRFFAEASRSGIKYIYAEASPCEPRAVAWMTSLGFSLDPRSQHFYRWSAN